MSVPELNVPMTRPSSSRSTVLRHSISRSSPDRVRIGVSTDWKIAGVKVAQLLSAVVPHPVREARVDPVASEQLGLGPPQEVAALAVDERDAPVQVEGEQDDLGRVQVSLRPVPFMA